MNTTLKTILGIVAVVVIGLAAGYVGGNSVKITVNIPASDQNNLGGTDSNRLMNFNEGITATVSPGGTNQALAVTGSSSFAWTVNLAGIRFGTGITYASGTSAANSTTSVTGAQVCNTPIIQWAPTTAGATATLPTASELLATNCFKGEGSYKEVLWRNTSNAASTTLFTAGASTTLQFASGTAATAPLIGGDSQVMTYQLVTTTDTAATMFEVNVLQYR